MAHSSITLSMTLRLLVAFYTALAAAVSTQEPLLEKSTLSYKLGDAIPVSCLNRTAEGDHVTTSTGQLQYIPFPTCNETGRPLEFYFGNEQSQNCTIDFITDEIFHLLQYFVHNDAPFTCRIPSRPLAPTTSAIETGSSSADQGQGAPGSDYIPLIIALTGSLQLSHLHVSSHLNVLLHAAPKATDPGVIAAGTAYSIGTSDTSSTRIIVGDALPLQFSVRWYPNTQLPSGWTGMGGHVYMSTLMYCLLSIGGTAAVCLAYFRGIELPRRLRSHGKERMAAVEGGGRLGGYGYGIGGGSNGYAVPKRD